MQVRRGRRRRLRRLAPRSLPPRGRPGEAGGAGRVDGAEEQEQGDILRLEVRPVQEEGGGGGGGERIRIRHGRGRLKAFSDQ